MRTRTQVSRDAALRRLARLNHTLAVAAVVGTGVITDAVANTASGHTRTVATATNTSGVEADEGPAATVTQAPRHHTARRAVHHTAATTTPPVSTVQPTAVVAVSGGS